MKSNTNFQEEEIKKSEALDEKYYTNEDTTLKLQETNSIIFCGKYPNDKEEVLRISKDGFYYKGEKVEDIHNVYERFNDWLNDAKSKTEWQPQDIKDFLSDFCSVTDEDSIIKKGKEVFHDCLDKKYPESVAEAFADGYEKALMDIYKQI